MNSRQGYGDRTRQFSAPDTDNEPSYGGQNFDDRERRGHNFDRDRRGQNYEREGRGQSFDREGRGQSFDREGREQHFDREVRVQNFERDGRGQNFEREGRMQNFEREGRGQNFNRDNRGSNFDRGNRGPDFEESETRYESSRGLGSHPSEGGPRGMRGDGMGPSNPRPSGNLGIPPAGPPTMMDPTSAGGYNGMGPTQPGGFGGIVPPAGGFPGMGPSLPGLPPGAGMNMPRSMGVGGGMNMPQQNFGGCNPSEADLVSSIQTLSQMTSQSDIASKIISAVLSTVPNLAQGNMGNPMNNPPGNMQFQGGPSGGPGPMGMNNNFPGQQGNGPFRNNAMNNFGDRRPYPRRSSPPRSRRFSGPNRDRFKDDRRGKRPSVSSGRGSSRGRFERSPDIKKRLAYKSSKRERENKVKEESFNSKRRRLSGEKADVDKKKEVHSKEAVMKSKRSDLKDEPLSSDEKTVDDQGQPKEETVAEVKKKKWEEVPPAALFCHICNQGKFTSEQTYLYHLEGVRHKKTANSFWDKNDATLEYLRKNAKLASIRFGGFDNSFTPSTCNICFAVVKESFKNHKRLLEHKLVSRFLMPRCCGRRFKSRHDMDEHRLSLPHLRRIYEKNEARNVAVEESENQTNASFKEVMDELNKRITADMEEVNLANLPPFDGNQMIGINYLELKESVLCKPCHMLLPIGSKSIEGHLVSLSHYNALQEYLINNKSKENKEGDHKESAGGDTSTTTTTTTNTKLRRERDEKDSDEEDSEDDDLARHIALSDAEDDDLPFIDETNHIVLEEVDENDDKAKSVETEEQEDGRKHDDDDELENEEAKDDGEEFKDDGEEFKDDDDEEFKDEEYKEEDEFKEEPTDFDLEDD